MSIKQMNRISIVWGVILICIVLLLTIFGVFYKRKSSDYKKLEEKIVNASEKYVESKFLYPDANQTVKITYEELKENGFIDTLQKDNEPCNGYSILSYDGHVYHYEGYIKCPNYTSKNYKE